MHIDAHVEKERQKDRKKESEKKTDTHSHTCMYIYAYMYTHVYITTNMGHPLFWANAIAIGSIVKLKGCTVFGIGIKRWVKT